MSRSMRRALVPILAISLVGVTSSFVLADAPPKKRPPAGPVQPELEQLTWEPLPDLADLNNWETYNAYNVVHYVSHNLTNRQPNDMTSDDPPGDPNPACMLKGDLAAPSCMYNHQLEYLAWWEEALTGVLKDFGVTFRTYEFESPGDTFANFATNAGRAINRLAIVPGADHPEDLVVIGSHYDQVDGSPYSAWDQTAGTGVLLRTAKMLADYWRATGTRPSNTYVFAAWDAEEAGGHGSKLYVGAKNNRTSEDGTLPKDPEVTLTAYINHDPCGAHYPALYRGLPASRNPLVEKTGFIPMNIALHEPAGSASETDRMAAFNEFILAAIHDLFDYIDDTLPVTVSQVPVELPVFISTDEAAEMGAEVLEQESVLKITEQGLLLFTTDAEDFHDWVPSLNPYPDFVGPHSGPDGPEDVGWSADGLAWIHTPIDHFEELVRYTSADQTGLGYSKGLAMSWEFCSMLSAWTMLQPAMGGIQAANDDVVAFFETPTPNQNGGTQTFDASGSYRYTNVAKRTMKTKGLVYRWDFGDGSVITTKKPVLEHRFPTTVKAYQVTLTVIDPKTGQSDQMSLRIGTGRLAKP